MDRETWLATVHGVTEVRQNWVTEHTDTHTHTHTHHTHTHTHTHGILNLMYTILI